MQREMHTDAEVVQLAREYLVRSGVEADGLVVDPHVQVTAGNERIVHFQRQRHGVPVFLAHAAVHVAGDGALTEIVGELNAADADPTLAPAIDAVAALERALEHFRKRQARDAVCHERHRVIRRPSTAARIITSFPLPSRPSVLRLPRGREQFSAHLVIWPAETARLAWAIRLPFAGRGQFLVLVAATGSDAGRILYCTRWSSSAKCFGTVFGFDRAAGRTRVPFPTPRASFAAELTAHPYAAQLADWVTTDSTLGDNVVTFWGNKETPLRATQGAGGLEFAVDASADGRAQCLLNGFYFCNYLHDFFLMLGFGPREGNFQAATGSGSHGGDRLEIMIFDKKWSELGDMQAHLDGEPAQLSVGTSPSNQRVVLHADVVTHEYAHGVSHRIVGGRHGAFSLIEPQSLAIDEGWSDYFAITIRNHHLATRKYSFAEWSGSKLVKRSADYDSSYPGHFGLLGKKPHHSSHGAGEVFAVALIRFNELLGQRLGDAVRGDVIGWRAVVESMKHVPSNPNFLEARDALYKAIEAMKNGGSLSASDAADARAAAEAAFLRYRMGPNARSNGTALGGTTPDP